MAHEKPKPESDAEEIPKISSGTRTWWQTWRWKLLFVAFFTLFIISADSYFKFERKVADLLIDLNSVPPQNKQVVIVGITEEDYKNLFSSTSPLSPVVVTEIINAISKGEPKALGIDLLTSDEIHKNYFPKESPFPIVWSEEAEKNERKEIKDYKGPLGAQQLPNNNYAALPEVPVESDSVYRLYQRAIEVKAKSEKAHPTFAWRVYELARPEEAKTKQANNQDYYIRFAGRKQQDQRTVIPASQILQDLANNDIQELKRFLKDKIVLLGGMFSDSRDRGAVPFGQIYGVEMNATIIETELYGHPRKSVSSTGRTFINLLMMLVFTTNFSYFGINPKSIAIAMIGILVLGVFFSVGGYGNMSGASIVLMIIVYGLFTVLSKILTDRYKTTLSSLFDGIASYVNERGWKRLISNSRKG